MDLSFVANSTRKVAKLVAKNSPVILTSLGVAGTITTAVMAGKAALKARDVINAHEMDEELRVETWEEKEVSENNEKYDIHVYYRERTLWEKARLTWRIWMPPILMGGATISCIIGANTINAKRNLALAAAYSMSEEAAKEFKDKVTETIGERKTEKIENAITQDKLNANPEPDEENILYTADGEQLMYDEWTGRYFRSCQQEIEKKVNMLNKHMVSKKCSSNVNDLYELMGLPTVPIGEDFGWYYNPDVDDADVTVHYYPCFSTKQTPCIGVRINPMLLYTYSN